MVTHGVKQKPFWQDPNNKNLPVCFSYSWWQRWSARWCSYVYNLPPVEGISRRKKFNLIFFGRPAGRLASSRQTELFPNRN